MCGNMSTPESNNMRDSVSVQVFLEIWIAKNNLFGFAYLTIFWMSDQTGEIALSV